MTVWTESFDSFNANTAATGGIATRWTGAFASGNLGVGRFGGQAFTTTGTTDVSITTTLSTTTFRFSLAIKGESGVVSLANTGRFFFYAGATAIFHLRLFDGTLYILSGTSTTVLGSIPNVSQTLWHTVSAYVVISATVGEIHLRVDSDDTKRVDLTGLNLGSAAFDRLRMQGASSLQNSYDDVVIDDSASATFFPELRIQQILVNSDGGTLNFTPSTGTSHFAVVDEALCSTADYLSGTAVGDHDLLGLQDLSIIPASIVAVKAVGFAAKTDAAARSWNLGLVSGATTSLGSNLSLTTGTQYYERVFETDPDTAAAWTQSGINALAMRPQVAV